MIDQAKYLNDLSGTHGHIRTFTGKYIDPLNPDPAKVDLRDIAHALSNQARFAGHTSKFYSVGQHCLRVADRFIDPKLRLAALLHDAEEAYLMDMPSPVKHRMPEYVAAGINLRRAIFSKFGLDNHDELMAAIGDADRKELRLEMANFFPQDEVLPPRDVIMPFKPGLVETIYLAAVVAELQYLHRKAQTAHVSDCAVHNPPALPAGPCDC